MLRSMHSLVEVSISDEKENTVLVEAAPLWASLMPFQLAAPAWSLIPKGERNRTRTPHTSVIHFGV
jgi:hypothetical protein